MFTLYSPMCKLNHLADDLHDLAQADAQQLLLDKTEIYLIAQRASCSRRWQKKMALSISKAFVKAHDVTITATSEGLGQGTTVQFTLPSATNPR
jgi:light-regulated signal transduction histidine kinase (bacteriophytochrome)